MFIFLDILFRFCVRSIQRYFLKKGLGGRKTIIIGRGEDAYHIANEININPSLGFTLAGYFNESDLKGARKFATLGLGFKYSAIDIDVSYLFSTTQVRNPLENTLRFGITFSFGNEYVEY